MTLLLDFGWLVLGLILLYFGAEWMVKGAKEIALKLGISPIIVALTVVAFGTSVPELLVSLQANLQDPPKGDLALGNIVGSNICNIALILGIGAVIRPIEIHLQIVKREMPLLLIFSVLFVAFLWNGSISRWEGGVLFSSILIYIYASIRLAKKEPSSVAVIDLTVDEAELEQIKAGGKRIVLDVLLILAGLALLVAGANRLILGGSNIAAYFGVSEAVIGLTVVAFGTSLPELATTVVAAIRRHGDFITGNAVGSCMFNLLCVIGLTALVAPLVRTPALTNIDLGMMLGLSFLIFPFMWSRRRVSRLEGVVLLVIYLAYVSYLATKGG